MLRIDGLHKHYGERVALDGLSFAARSGRLCGFLGANGAGKTTTMRCIFGMVTPDAGTVRWNDATVGLAERRRFGYLPEQRGLYPKMAIDDQLIYHGRLHGMSRTDAREATAALLAELGLAERATDRLEVLSHGNQQRIQLAAALVHGPDVLVLDEPFSGLDPLGVAAMASSLHSRAAAGATIVFSSHQLDLVEDLCDDVVLIDEGRLVLEGPLAQVREQPGTRVVEVTFTAPTTWTPPAASGPVVTGDDGRRVSAPVRAEIDVDELVRSAREAGGLSSFTFRPPSLAEIFRARVARVGAVPR